nr:hypothetical protein [Pelagerythrobacter marinus]
MTLEHVAQDAVGQAAPSVVHGHHLFAHDHAIGERDGTNVAFHRATGQDRREQAVGPVHAAKHGPGPLCGDGDIVLMSDRGH